VSPLDLPREYRAMLKELGLEILEARQRKHYRVKVRHPVHGEYTFTLPTSPSDKRSMLNNRSYIKRFLKGGIP